MAERLRPRTSLSGSRPPLSRVGPEGRVHKNLTFVTWLPERCRVDTTAAATVRVVTKQYLILIEQLVRDGRSESEIEHIVKQVVAEDERQQDGELDELRPAA